MNKNEELLYDYLHDFRAETGKCNPSNKDILEVVNMNERTLYRTLKSLEEKGLIKRETISVGNFGKTRVIHVI